jgi:hypothetical protein
VQPVYLKTPARFAGPHRLQQSTFDPTAVSPAHCGCLLQPQLLSLQHQQQRNFATHDRHVGGAGRQATSEFGRRAPPSSAASSSALPSKSTDATATKNEGSDALLSRLRQRMDAFKATSKQKQESGPERGGNVTQTWRPKGHDKGGGKGRAASPLKPYDGFVQSSQPRRAGMGTALRDTGSGPKKTTSTSFNQIREKLRKKMGSAPPKARVPLTARPGTTGSATEDRLASQINSKIRTTPEVQPTATPPQPLPEKITVAASNTVDNIPAKRKEPRKRQLSLLEEASSAESQFDEDRMELGMSVIGILQNAHFVCKS